MAQPGGTPVVPDKKLSYTQIPQVTTVGASRTIVISPCCGRQSFSLAEPCPRLFCQSLPIPIRGQYETLHFLSALK